MYIIQCVKSGIGDFYDYYSIDGGLVLGTPFRKGQYLTDDSYGTRSLNRAETFRTKLAAQERLYNFNTDLNEDDEPIPEFAVVPVTISLK